MNYRLYLICSGIEFYKKLLLLAVLPIGVSHSVLHLQFKYHSLSMVVIFDRVNQLILGQPSIRKSYLIILSPLNITSPDRIDAKFSGVSSLDTSTASDNFFLVLSKSSVKVEVFCRLFFVCCRLNWCCFPNIVCSMPVRWFLKRMNSFIFSSDWNRSVLCESTEELQEH